MSKTTQIKGQLVDIHSREIYPAGIQLKNGLIDSITKITEAPPHFILPAFVDAHIHIESSMVVPYEFARVALRHGTVATVSDPHEIANVVGMDGVNYMIENARSAQLKFHFGAPSCVPATSFETAGATLDATDVERLLHSDDIYYLSEMMNYPGVIYGDEQVFMKIQAAKDLNMPIDGHAPGLRGEDLRKYINSGISTDHECFTLEEALEKLEYGMKIIIREGSAAKNFNALHSLIKSHPAMTMFCSDDKHPDDLLIGHINEMVIRSLKIGYDLFDILQIACKNPVEHYKLPVGLLREKDPADFIVVKDLESFELIQSYIDGQCVVENGQVLLEVRKHPVINHFNANKKSSGDFIKKGHGKKTPVIVALDGELITKKKYFDLPAIEKLIFPDLNHDVLKIAVVNRYTDAPVEVGFIHGFNIGSGAIASSVGHDSHNIIVVGTSDDWMAKAVNLIIDQKGGLSAINEQYNERLALPIAGLMSDLSCQEVGLAYERLDRAAKKMGSTLGAPFMTLSFMALLVIPELKMSDLGLFDAVEFKFVEAKAD